MHDILYAAASEFACCPSAGGVLVVWTEAKSVHWTYTHWILSLVEVMSQWLTVCSVCRRCVVTRSSQGGQVQPLLTAPTDVTWQDKKGLYEVSITALRPSSWLCIIHTLLCFMLQQMHASMQCRCTLCDKGALAELHATAPAYTP